MLPKEPKGVSMHKSLPISHVRACEHVCVCMHILHVYVCLALTSLWYVCSHTCTCELPQRSPWLCSVNL